MKREGKPKASIEKATPTSGRENGAEKTRRRKRWRSKCRIDKKEIRWKGRQEPDKNQKDWAQGDRKNKENMDEECG